MNRSSSTPLTVLELSGSPRTMGEAFGEQLREEARELYAIRLSSALHQAHEQGCRDATESNLHRLARAAFRITADFDPPSADEMEGIARGSGLGIEEIVVLSGLTDLRDALSWWAGGELFGGCTAVMVQRDTTRNGSVLCGQTWDLGTDNMPFVLAVRRRPAGGLASVCLTVAGSLPFLGINEAGLAVGTTNLRTRDARPGVVYVTLIDRALRSRTPDEARRSMVTAPRAGGHFFYLANAGGHALSLECTAQQAVTEAIEGGVFVHTNHCLVVGHQAIDVDGDNASSKARLRRMTELCERARGELDMATLKELFADTAGGAHAICRDDIDGTSTNAAAVFDLENRRLLACHGLPSRGTWSELCV